MRESGISVGGFGGGSGGAQSGPQAVKNGWWQRANSSEGGLIIDGCNLTPGETIIYRKLLAIEKMLNDASRAISEAATPASE